jgi:serpin B
MFPARSALSGGILLTVLTLACDDPVGPQRPDPITELPRALTVAELTVIANSNSFGFDLLREVDLRRDQGEPNTILSPLSASMALGMALEGAEGETFTEMQSVLGFGGLTREETTASYAGLLELLLDLDPAVELGIANSAWSRLGISFLPSFFDALANSFQAVAQELDFDDPGAKDTINQWVQDRTNGRIDTIIDQITDEVLFLINAVYFRGDWTTKFKPENTQQSAFHLEDGSTVSVPTMSGDIEDAGFAWLGDNRIVAELPYGGQAFGMVLVLPAPGEEVGDLLATLDDATWAGWMASLRSEKVQVRMPRFELEWGGVLDDALKAMGMEQAFSDLQADFSRMSEVTDLFISEVRQKTYMKVDEEGTEAAAATSVGIMPTSLPPGITLDRPYLLAIRERLSGTILFLGAIRDPR